jgi:hypothetical protein
MGISREAGVECRRFLRNAGVGYNREIDMVYNEVSAWSPELIVEMHFNGGGGDYAVMLHGKEAPRSASAAAAMLHVFASRLEIRSWGLMPVARDGRGGRSVTATKIPTVLTEPFFGDRDEHVKKVNEIGVTGMAKVYLEAITEALRVI